MDRDMIVGQLMQRGKCFIEHSLEAAGLQTVATASVAIFDQMQEVAWEMLQAKVNLEAHKLRSQAVVPCCPESARYCMGCSAFPPLAKGVGGIYGGCAQGKRCKIPLSPPLTKGEGRVAAALGDSWLEKHTWLESEKVSVATTAGGGSILGAELAESTSADALEKAYGVFAAEARLLDEDYAPETVCTEGGEARQSAWEKIFVAPVLSIIYLLRIFLGFGLGLSCTIPIPEMFQGHAYYFLLSSCP
jgi:hypothetical protein